MALIRASYTSMWPDCKRRQAAKMFKIEVIEAGYKLRELPPSIGAPVGTATHAAAAFAMQEKLERGTLPADAVAEEAGLEELDNRIGVDGVQWDATTPDRNTAQKQVRRQYKVYRIHLAEKLMPIEVERRITITTANGNDLSGQIDLTTEGLRDLKTGTTKRANHAQYGTYSILRRQEGGRVDYLSEDFIQRVRLDKEQPKPIEVAYDRDLCERIAALTIKDIEATYKSFKESGDAMAFSANPNSMLCMDRFCPAWGTDFCREGRGS